MNTKQTDNLLAHLRALRQERDTIAEKINTVVRMLNKSGVGIYKNGSITVMKKKEIKVKAYTRSAHRVIRTKRSNML